MAVGRCWHRRPRDPSRAGASLPAVLDDGLVENGVASQDRLASFGRKDAQIQTIAFSVHSRPGLQHVLASIASPSSPC